MEGATRILYGLTNLLVGLDRRSLSDLQSSSFRLRNFQSLALPSPAIVLLTVSLSCTPGYSPANLVQSNNTLLLHLPAVQCTYGMLYNVQGVIIAQCPLRIAIFHNIFQKRNWWTHCTCIFEIEGIRVQSPTFFQRCKFLQKCKIFEIFLFRFFLQIQYSAVLKLQYCRAVILITKIPTL